MRASLRIIRTRELGSVVLWSPEPLGTQRVALLLELGSGEAN